MGQVGFGFLAHRGLTGRRSSVTYAGLFAGRSSPEAQNEGHVRGGRRVNQKDAKRFKKMLDESKRALLVNARKTLMEELNFDTDDLPDEIDLASSEYSQSMIFRLRDREKFLLKKIDKALQRIETGNFGICERCEDEILDEAARGAAGDDPLHPLQRGARKEREELRLKHRLPRVKSRGKPS